MTVSRIPVRVDIKVGGRVRFRRKMAGMSRSELGDRIGVTFQQVQKYERGTNRIGSGRIQQTANAPGTDAASLFEDHELDASVLPEGVEPEDARLAKDAVDLNKSFIRILDPGVRAAVVAWS